MQISISGSAVFSDISGPTINTIYNQNDVSLDDSDLTKYFRVQMNNNNTRGRGIIQLLDKNDAVVFEEAWHSTQSRGIRLFHGVAGEKTGGLVGGVWKEWYVDAASFATGKIVLTKLGATDLFGFAHIETAAMDEVPPRAFTCISSGHGTLSVVIPFTVS